MAKSCDTLGEPTLCQLVVVAIVEWLNVEYEEPIGHFMLVAHDSRIQG